jgi:Secretion system C-terminal sorting domain
VYVGKNIQYIGFGTRGTGGTATVLPQPVSGTQFTVTAMPNPSATDFTVRVTGSSAEPVQVRVIDIAGREISKTKLDGRTTFTSLGIDLKPGTYMAEITQGLNKKVVKLIKTQ